MTASRISWVRGQDAQQSDMGEVVPRSVVPDDATTKLFWLDGPGMHRVSSCVMPAGAAIRMSLTLRFARLLKGRLNHVLSEFHQATWRTRV